MTLFLPRALPAFSDLQNESLLVRPNDVVPTDALRVLLVNIMPRQDKAATELQFGRLLAQSGHDVSLSLTCPDEAWGEARGEHVLRHYTPFSAQAPKGFDALIVTGAPLEFVSFDKVTYWSSLAEIFDWSAQHVASSLFVCWGAQAALYHFYGVEKQLAKQKLFGLYPQKVLEAPKGACAARLCQAFRGLKPENLALPVSRSCYPSREEIARKAPEVEIVLDNEAVHPGLLVDEKGRRLFAFNHPEYDGDRLGNEYRRDAALNPEFQKPHGYDLAEGAYGAVPPWRAAAQVTVSRLIEEAAQNRKWRSHPQPRVFRADAWPNSDRLGKNATIRLEAL